MKFTAWITTLALVHAPALAWAQSESAPRSKSTASATQLQTAQRASPSAAWLPRFRLGVGYHGGAVFLLNTTVGLYGLYLRVGAQTSELFGIDLDLSTSSLGVSGYGRAAIRADFTPIDMLSISVGPVAAFGYNFLPRSQWFGVNTTLEFHALPYRWDSGVRSAFSLGLGADIGSGQPFADTHFQLMGGAYFTVGYSRY